MISSSFKFVEDLLLNTIRNNAHWCDHVVRKKGNSTLFTTLSWHSSQPVPENYPNLITLKKDLDESEALELQKTIESIPLDKFSIKDSFSELEIKNIDFSILFTASWILWDKKANPKADLKNWQHETDPDADVNYAVKLVNGKPASGFITNISDGVIGVTNVFHEDKNEDFWPECTAYIRQNISKLPIVGYERDVELMLSKKAGFEEVGKLRILSLS